jgi:hypothetical protein
MARWRIWSTQREYIVEGTKVEANEVRRRKARWHGCVFRMAPLAMVLLLSAVAHASPPTINLTGRIDGDTIGLSEKGRSIWVESYRKAEELLKKLERAIRGDMEDHERQCFLQEALKHIIPSVKGDTSITGKPLWDVSPETMQYVLKKLDQVNRCSPNNRGYIAFHAWKDSGFQEPRQLPSGQKMTLTEFIRGVAALGVGVGETVPAAAVTNPAGMLPLLIDPRTVAPHQDEPKPGEVY